MIATDYYLAYARLKLTVQQARDAQSSVRFFRRSLDHSRIWMLVIEGHYSGRPPSVQECIGAARCSRMTARRVLEDAEAMGFLSIRIDETSRRRREVVPTLLCIQQYEVVVDRHLRAWNVTAEESKL